MDELLKKHKQEKKDLQANIQKMKQLVPKNDKKRRKELTQKIEEMESDLKRTQQDEISKFNQENNTSNEQFSQKSDDKPIIDKLEQLQINLESNQMNFESNQSTKISKAQKRRERKEREQFEREQRALIEDERTSENHVRTIENNKFKKLFKDHNLKLYDIPSDGDCMYKAIEHQLNLNNVSEYNVDELRKITANSLRKNKSNYLPFLITSDQDNLMNDNEFENYCTEIEKTKKWGGNVELQVISNELKVNINVYQADGPVIKFECKNSIINKPLLISFHKYLYQLGGHYNSLLREDKLVN